MPIMTRSCKQRGNHQKDTKAALKAQLEVMDAAAKKTTEGSPGDIDTSMTLLGKRPRTAEGAMGTGAGVAGNIEKRPRSAALDIALAVD